MWWATHCSGTDQDCCDACPYIYQPRIRPYGASGIQCTGAGGTIDRISLYGNALTGTIPEQIGDHAGLDRLDLDSNALTGPVPASLAGLAKLWELDLSGNRLSGALPPALGDLPELTHLYLRGNPTLSCPVADYRDKLLKVGTIFRILKVLQNLKHESSATIL